MLMYTVLFTDATICLLAADGPMHAQCLAHNKTGKVPMAVSLADTSLVY